jgi:hypothetical protein
VYDQGDIEEAPSLFSQRIAQLYYDTASPIPDENEDEDADGVVPVSDADNLLARRGRYATEGLPRISDLEIDEDGSIGQYMRRQLHRPLVRFLLRWRRIQCDGT